MSDLLAILRRCRCGCCVERVDFINHGRRDVGCHCDAHPDDEQCDCPGCIEHREPVRE